MSVKVAYRDGVFEPLCDFLETLGWLKAAEKSVELWNNPADALYDAL